MAQPVGFDFATFDINGEILYTIMYHDNPVPQGRLIQIIRPNNDNLHPPIMSGDLRGAPSNGDVINSIWQVGGSTEADGLFALFLTNSIIVNPPHTTLIGGQNFYFRVWADVNVGATYPFPVGSHYVDGGQYLAPMIDGSIWDVHVNPNSSTPNWQICNPINSPALIVTETNDSALVTPVNFGSVRIGSDVNHTIRFTNAGNAALTISNDTISVDFHHSAITSPLAPGDHLDVTLTFRPAESIR